jgi:hypothetical protein
LKIRKNNWINHQNSCEIWAPSWRNTIRNISRCRCCWGLIQQTTFAIIQNHMSWRLIGRSRHLCMRTHNPKCHTAPAWTKCSAVYIHPIKLQVCKSTNQMPWNCICKSMNQNQMPWNYTFISLWIKCHKTTRLQIYESNAMKPHVCKSMNYNPNGTPFNWLVVCLYHVIFTLSTIYDREL